MRAPFCNDSTDLCPEDKGIILSENDSEREIHAIARSLSRPPGKKTAVFGICLDDLMGTTTQVAPRIPFIITRLCRYIETHGLHYKRLFLEGDEKNIVETLKVEFIECGDASLETVDHVASVARLLIIFFEELPEPLIPASAQPDFIRDMERLSLNSEDCITHLKLNVGKLPDSAYQVLKYLSRFLLRVASCKEYNGMSYDNLAVIFGPLIFRPTSDDPTVHLKLKYIVNCLVQDYYFIFEEDSRSKTEENHSSMELSTRICRQLPCPSSLPVISLSPLSVFIPCMDTSGSDDDVSKDNGPALLIERKMDVPTKGNISPCNNKDNLGSFVTRKRKERRLSGEDGQARSSSEERPTPSALVQFEKMEVIRRCNSHEEVDIKSNEEADKSSQNSQNKGELSHVADSYLSDTMELVINEKNHSPHPPNAKRREVDVSESNMESSDRWKCHSLSKFSEYRNPAASTDLPCQRISKQNPIAEFTEKITMDCDAVVEDGESKTSGIPRSASCPVPKGDNDGDSESGSSSLSMSWSMLFEDSEPVRSDAPLSWSLSKEVQDDALLSPSIQKLRNDNFYEAPLSPSAYRSYLSHRSTHLDPSVPPSPPVEQEDFAKKLVESSGVSDSIKTLTKKIHNIKRRIRKFDEKFESEFGYKPSHAEKSNNPEAKKLLSDLYKARKELKAVKEEAHLEHVSSSTSRWHISHCGPILGDTTNHFLQESGRDKSIPSLEDSLGVTLKSLANDRKFAHRPELVEAMTTDQVKDEKLAMQKALLHFESLHCKPFSKEERRTIRPLYDRYRNVKKLLVRSGSFPGSVSKNKDLCSELQPILEHETMEFPSREQRANDELVCEVEELEKECSKREEKPTETPVAEDDTKSTTGSCFLTKYDNSNFHELPLSEMIFQMQKVKSEKRHLRKILKEFETEFLKLNGRKVQKEDKAPVDTIYGEYKHVKARLKLLEALISKHDQHQLM